MVGTDRDVDRRLPAVAEVEIPFYAGLEIGMPSLPAMVEALAEGHFDAVHLTAPGPAGVMAALIARIMELPLLGSWHTELGAYAGLRSALARAGAGDATWRCRSSIGSAAGALAEPRERRVARRARNRRARRWAAGGAGSTPPA